MGRIADALREQKREGPGEALFGATDPDPRSAEFLGDTFASSRRSGAELFMKSVVSAAGPELIGLDPALDVEGFRNQNPVAGFMSEFLGVGTTFSAPFLVPGLAGLGLVAKIPGIGRAVGLTARTIEAGGRPFAAGAAREALRFAPLEAARLGGSALAGGDTGEVAKSVAFDLAAFGVFGGVLTKLSKVAPQGAAVSKLAEIGRRFPTVDPLDPPQLSLGKLKFLRPGLEKNGHADLVDTTEDAIRILRAEVRTQVPRKGGHVGKLASEGDFAGLSAPGNAALRLNQILKPGDSPKRATSILGTLDDVLRAEQKELQGVVLEEGLLGEVLSKAGVTEQNEHLMQFGRHVLAKTEGESVGIRKMLRPEGEMFLNVGENTFLTREAGEDGLFLMGKIIEGSPLGRRLVRAAPSTRTTAEGRVLQAGRVRVLEAEGLAEGGAAGDQFVFFKTSNPGAFSPEARRFGETFMRTSFTLEEASKIIPAQVLNNSDTQRTMQQLLEVFPSSLEFKALSRKGVTAAFESVVPRLPAGAQRTARNLQKFTTFASENFRKNLAPTLSQFTNAEAQRIMTVARALFQHNENRAIRAFGEEIEGAITAVYKAGPQKDLRVQQFLRAINEQIGPDDIDGILPEPRAALEALSRVDNAEVREIVTLEAFTDTRQKFSPRAFHYGISKLFRGNVRVPVRQKGTAELVGYGSGRTEAEAIREARAVVEEMGPEAGGKLFVEAEGNAIRTATRGADDLELVSALNPTDDSVEFFSARSRLMGTRPLRFRKATGKLGFALDLSEQELKDITLSNLIEGGRYKAALVVKNSLGADIAKLNQHFSGQSAQLERRLNDLQGRKSGFIAQMDRTIDKAFANVPGFRNTNAGEVIRKANRFMFNWTLTAADLGFVTLNALTPVQTVLPELAFLKGAAPERLAKYYGMQLMRNPQTGQISSMSFLDPAKILKESFKDLVNPSPELRQALDRAIKEGVFAPKFIEEMIQTGSFMQKRISKAMQSGNYVEVMTTINELLPAQSEKFSRAIAFLSGRRMFKDLFQLEGEALFRASTKFTQRTMFMYTTADRPRMITGQMGTLFGLFKNWPMHYVANMMTYGGEAFRGNMAPLMWMMGGTLGTGGLVGLPMFGAADQASRLLSDRGLVANAMDFFGYGEGTVPDRALDSVFYGLPAFGGLSISGRAAVPTSNFFRDITSLYNVATFDRMIAMGDAMGGMWTNFVNGPGLQHPAADQRTFDALLRATAPRTFYRALSFAADNGLKSLRTGNKLISRATIPERLAFTLGFTPTRFEQVFEASEDLYNQQEKLRTQIQVFGEQLAQNLEVGNWKGVNDTLVAAMFRGVPYDSVWRSGQSRLQKREQPLLDRQFDPEEVAKRLVPFGLEP